MPILIKLTSDFICPWCLIGTARLFRVLDSLREGIETEVAFLPFELNPDMPKDGMERKLYRTRKFGSWERSLAMDAQTEAVAVADGMAIDYSRIRRTPNTFDAHRLCWLAARENRQRAVVEGIFDGYFAQGRDIGNSEVLSAIGADAGMDRGSVELFLSGSGSEPVRDLEREAYRKGIQGVPYFEIDGLAISGAQSAEVLRRTVTYAHARRTMVVN